MRHKNDISTKLTSKAHIHNSTLPQHSIRQAHRHAQGTHRFIRQVLFAQSLPHTFISIHYEPGKHIAQLLRQFCIPNSSACMPCFLYADSSFYMHCFLGQHFSKNILLALHIQHVAPSKLHASKAVATTIQLLLHTLQPFKQRWEKKLGRRVLASRDTGPKGAVRKAVAAPENASRTMVVASAVAGKHVG